MGLQYRKSKNLGGGVRLNVGKKSAGLSAGVKGARVSVNSKGRVGLSLGIPGTNFRYRKVMSSKKRRQRFYRRHCKSYLVASRRYDLGLLHDLRLPLEVRRAFV